MKEKSPLSKPKASSQFAQKELDRAEKQFEEFSENIKEMTLDRMNEAPKLEQEPQTKISGRDAQKSNEIWLKPKRSLAPGIDPKTGKREQFNEKFRADYEFDKEYVQFIAENKEIVGETISGIWTKPYGGVNAEEWDVPVNKPVWGPRYLAEQIKKANYHRFRMQDQVVTSADHMGSYTGQMIVDNVVQRLDAYPVSQRKSVFMGTKGF